jgi:hypothetical protein
MVQIYNEITIYIYKEFFLRGLRPRTPAGGPLAPLPAEGVPPPTPRVEECTYFWGVNTSWGINTAESKRPLNQEDNQAPQPTISHLETDLNNSTDVVYVGL